MKNTQATEQVAKAGESSADIDKSSIAFESVDNGIIIEGTDGLIRFVNQTFANILKELPEKIVNPPISDFLTRENTTTDSGKESEVFTLKREEGNISVTVSRTDLWLGECHVGTLNIFQQFNEFTRKPNKNNELTMRNSALEKEVLLMKMDVGRMPRFLQHDYLTKLPNRNLFLERLTNEIRIAKKFNYEVAVCYIDIDDLKAVNEKFGYYCGDKVIKETATRIQEIVGEGDTVARMEGDEFAVIIADYKDVKKFENIAEGINKSISRSVIIKGRKIQVSATMGISIYPLHTSLPRKMLKNARKAAIQKGISELSSFNMFDSTMESEMNDLETIELERCSEQMASVISDEEAELKNSSSGYKAMLALFRNRKMTVPMLSSILDMKHEPLIAFDLCGTIITANASFVERFSLKNDLVVGKHILEIPSLNEKSAKEIKSYIQLLKNTMTNEKGCQNGSMCRMVVDRKTCETATGENACEFRNIPSYIVAVLRPS